MPVNSDLPVLTAWDIGVDDAMAIWCFQVYPDHLDIVDYYEGHGMGFDHYCEWLNARGYHGTDWYPHDVKVREADRPEHAPGSRRSSRWAASRSWCRRPPAPNPSRRRR